MLRPADAAQLEENVQMAPPKDTMLVEVAPATAAANGKQACGPVYRNVLAKDGYATLPGVGTLYELFEASVSKFGSLPCLGSRTAKDGAAGDYVWSTYKETQARVASIGSGMKHVGVPLHGRCGVFGANSPEWLITMQACNRHTVYCVPLYDTLGENAIEFIINHAEVSIVFTASDKLPALVKALPRLTERVKTVVYWGGSDAAAEEAVKALGVGIYTFAAFEELGKANPAQADAPKPEDLCTIMYTSGTTGDPKGVLLTHKAVVACVAGQLAYLEQIGFKIDSNDTFLSYLPLAHIFDRVGEEALFSVGGRVAYWRGDIKGLLDDIMASKPTIFIGVPRVFDRIYAGVLGKVKEGGGIKAFLFNMGFRRKLAALRRGSPHNKAGGIWDSVVFSKVKQRLGGKVRLIVTGGAPLATHVEDFLKVTMCVPVVQGYGLTESAAANFIAVPDVPEAAGTVGVPMPVLEFKLEAVPEMNYSPAADPPRGEVVIRGDLLFSGYYKNKEQTDEVLESSGWFHTGDVGELAPGGLKIIDRKKNIFKLSQGEYVAVEKVEAVYKQNMVVEQLWVYGNSFENSLVAVVVPAEAPLMAWAKQNGVAGSYAEVARDPKAAAWMLSELTATGRAGKLKGFEAVKAVHLDTELFSVENDLMTPTFKMKRPQLLKKYQAQVDAMYADLKAKSAA